ncbi:hypothetical protein EWM64_g1877 [Hericium alpestre]|uniref:glutathione transferase n=1 Tax=Hericium alpestre TaxID=135208 RepID=A0A4Z0A6Z3_9AGAM|nr:hypothetical protein EWM64_g1877 [Hericium alpestre]
MVLKLHGSPHSTCTSRVVVVLKEKNVPYEIVPVDLGAGEHKSATFLEHQPFGQVPYLVRTPPPTTPLDHPYLICSDFQVDDGFELYESRAIARYIAAKWASQGTSLIPTEVKALGRFEQAASIEQSNFDAFAAPLAFEKTFKPMFGQTPDEARIVELSGQLDAKLAAYDKILAKQKYLAGDEITLADLFHLPYGDLVQSALDVFSKYPNVLRWWKEISSRPSWVAIKAAAA